MIHVLVVLAAAQTLSLADAEKNARDNLPNIHVAQAQTAVQKALRDQAASARWPQLSGQAQEVVTQRIAGATQIYGNDLGMSVSANQLIYDFHQTSDRVKAFEAAVSASEDTERTVWNAALLNVRTAYFTAQGNRELIRVAEANLKSQQGHVDQMAAFVEHGTHAPVDLAQAQQQRAAAQFQLVQATGAYWQSRATLQLAMGVDAAPDYDVSDEPFPPVPGEEKSTDELLEEALRERPEIANLRDQVSSQRLLIEVNKAGWLPTIGATLTLGLDLFSQFGSGTFLIPSGRAGVILNWPFWLGGVVNAQTRQAEAQLVAIQGQFDAQRQQIRNEVDLAKIAIATASEQLASAQESLRFAQEQLRLAEGQYVAGIGIALLVFDAQVAVASSGGQVAQSTAALAIARAQLLRALGRGRY